MLNFLKRKTIFFIVFILFITSGLFYYRYFFPISKTNLQCLKYEEIINKINTNQPENWHEAEIFIIKNNNIYGTLTSMFLAKKYISENKLNEAFIQLDNSLKYTKEENLKNILKLRIAKIKIQKKEHNAAMDILKSINNRNWINIIEQIKGDIFLNKKNKKLAIQHWKKSFSLETSNASKEIINMKINELK
ncbi:YfgM family protein [Buchnera aphidicola]|uniref:Yfgm n=1 Tax=Buchnera aphidicola str. USDA (Myzus persicae) TaxID=1009856 RepID=W0NZ94_BUCMP|nr:tetratricopeptide repeat protein [Buchnera aphidicola]AHG59806.1 Yfgm [Buchnera aphidicola str. USDA (Myzus persicae)]AHG60386.1 Yfgm [Buchnera aphidicola str. W106 (Myzus persicae)]AHG60959.1 Yfgm [Buchnera aphidicola str. G002 (Myzus persicae)]AHG61531.1 Yfgm [Buchnera aphidicola str. F009 (Myzus persicae)]WAI02954.1 MAG: tetratricopeptide repeat protein [Buchnera aphidicola (Myzus persicae)]